MTNFKVTKYPQGTFSWADCATTDAATAKQFYAELMGWQIEDFPMGDDLYYTMYSQDGCNTVGLSPMPAGMDGVPSHWNSYISVDDVDALTDKAKELGATILAGPMDVFDNGRMVSFQDPTGAVVNLWQPKSHIGAQIVNTPGAMTWNELMTGDTEKAREFYGALLGWTFSPMEGMPDYHIIMNGTRPNGGIMSFPEGMEGVPPNWGVYIAVDDIDAKVAKAKELGATVPMGIIDSGDIGRMALVTDPTGATFEMIQSNNPQPWEE